MLEDDLEEAADEEDSADEVDDDEETDDEESADEVRFLLFAPFTTTSVKRRRILGKWMY